GGDEHHQLFVFDGAGGDVRQLTSSPDVIHHLGDWSPDGRQVAFAANARDRRHFDVHIYDLERGEVLLVLERDGFNVPVAFSRDGGRLLVRRPNTNMDADLFAIDLHPGKVRPLTPHAGEALFEHAHFSADGEGLYVVTDAGRDVSGLAYLALTDLSLRYL